MIIFSYISLMLFWKQSRNSTLGPTLTKIGLERHTGTPRRRLIAAAVLTEERIGQVSPIDQRGELQIASVCA